MDDNEELQQEKSNLETRVNHLKVLCERKENFVMNTKLVVRLREAQIASFEVVRGHHDDIIPPRTADEDELREEIKALRSIVELHPEVTRFAMENLELRDDIAKLDSISQI
jgi:kinesin family protein 15